MQTNTQNRILRKFDAEAIFVVPYSPYSTFWPANLLSVFQQIRVRYRFEAE